ncbi:MAG: histidinol dehydrogenase, partial [Gammaproteobacteria bacterium]|nr:histidinol dehydrogenase [Gammaproteobacteria bacterium]
PSTALMTVIPARVAGVGEVIVTTPTPAGKCSDHLLAALFIAGPDRVFTVGGAQAIAALAWGTETVPQVHKIVGPGGAFVTAAKRLVFGPVGIDSLAGPSEVVVIADGSVAPAWTALDLLAQAEHDADAQAILLSPDAGYLDRVEQAAAESLRSLSRADIIRDSLASRGALVHTRNLAEACDIANRIAPEHLELAVRDPDALLPSIRHAGAIFLGGHAAEVIGDYSAGPSHVLPTFGTARYASPLSVTDFQKRSSLVRCNETSVQEPARLAANVAESEGLSAHAAAAHARIAGFDDNRA